jgi:hypothetical protein
MVLRLALLSREEALRSGECQFSVSWVSLMSACGGRISTLEPALDEVAFLS